MSGIFQNVAKIVGNEIPFPVYEVPMRFRGDMRIVQYTLFRKDEKTVGSNGWFKCQELRYPESNIWDPCLCCPELNYVEEIAMMAIISADASIPGSPI